MQISNIRTIAAATVMSVALVLTGCSGGGGAQGSASPVNPTQSSAATVTLSVTDGTGAATDQVTTLSNANVTATVKDASGNILKNVLVTFTTDQAYLTFNPSSGTASTGSSGTLATVAVAPAAKGASGAAALTAMATLADGTQVTSAPSIVTVKGQGNATLTLQVTDSSGNSTSSITAPASISVNGVVRDAAGVIQKNVLVTFIADSKYLAPTPSSGTASTGSTGTAATIALTPVAATSGGATQINATATMPDGSTHVSATPVTISVTGLPANATSTPTLTMSLVDKNGLAATSLTVGSPLTINVTLKDGAGNPLPNTVIALTSGDPTLGVVSQASTLTNASGNASARLDAASIGAVGAAYVNATASVAGNNVMVSTPFQVGAATVTMGLVIGQANISAFGTTSVTATVSVNGAPPPSPMNVQFTSGCASTGKVTLPATVQTVNGVASATYSDKGCAQIDTVVATVGSVQQTGTITVAAPAVSNIQFVGTQPANGLMVLKGTGGQGYSETSTVTFKVTDSSGTPMSQQSVIMNLTTSLGGITIDGIAGPVTKLTQQDGTVSVNIQSGTAPTSVWVTASIGSITTQSNRLIISTGKPAQDFFSLSATTLNIDGGDFDGATTTLTVYASDRLGNIVPDGTAINFISEGGQIVNLSGEPTSVCTTVGGTCSVTLRSAESRPRTDTEPGGHFGPIVTKDRVTVLAYTLGEESFKDANGNNYHDAGEAWDDLGDIFIDNNENSQWNAGEQVIRYNLTNATACPALPASGKLNNAASVPGTCDGIWGAAHVRRSMVIVFSGDHPQTPDAGPIVIPDPTVVWDDTVAPGTPFPILSTTIHCSTGYDIHLSDENNNPMPARTTLSIANNAVYSGGTAAAITVNPSTVPNTSAAGPTIHTVMITVPPASCGSTPAGTFSLNASTPAVTSNLTTTLPMYIVREGPSVSSLNPNSLIVSGGSQNLVINGRNFISGNVVQFKWGKGANVWTNSNAAPTVSSPFKITVAVDPGAATDVLWVRVCDSSSTCSSPWPMWVM